MSPNHPLSLRLARFLGMSLTLVFSSGCVIIPRDMMIRIEAQRIANSHLAAVVAVFILVLPLAVWCGLVWGTRSLSLKSWWLLLSVECVLMAAFVSARAYFS